MSLVTGRTALADAVRKLAAAGIVAPARDARLLLAEVLSVAPDRLTLVEGDPLETDAMARFSEMVFARSAGQPVAQIIGRRLFWGRSFSVNRNVLDPRPETETLIDVALAGPVPARILDLGTGSGAIMLTLLAEWPATRGLGTDISAEALAVALGNAVSLGVADRADFAQRDWFDGIEGSFDLIVSNPPYIRASTVELLDRDVREWEPHGALTAGSSGVESYARIASGLGKHLAPCGRALFEIGADQGESVPALFREAGFVVTAVFPDLDGRPRVVSLRMPGLGA